MSIRSFAALFVTLPALMAAQACLAPEALAAFKVELSGVGATRTLTVTSTGTSNAVVYSSTGLLRIDDSSFCVPPGTCQIETGDGCSGGRMTAFCGPVADVA